MKFKITALPFTLGSFMYGWWVDDFGYAITVWFIMLILIATKQVKMY